MVRVLRVKVKVSVAVALAGLVVRAAYRPLLLGYH